MHKSCKNWCEKVGWNWWSGDCRKFRCKKLGGGKDVKRLSKLDRMLNARNPEVKFGWSEQIWGKKGKKINEKLKGGKVEEFCEIFQNISSHRSEKSSLY